MVDALKGAQLLADPKVEDAFRNVDRGLFVPHPEIAYMDAPQTIGHEATISAPHMHASCAELLKDHLRPGGRVLDVGSGSGYLTVLLADMVRPGGLAVGIEHIPQLVERSREAADRIPWAADMLRNGSLVLTEGDGREGAPQYGPFDAIHVGAAADEIPRPLMAQLKPGGRMVIPVGGSRLNQKLVVIDRAADGSFARQDAMGVVYVPLTSRELQLGRPHN